MHLPLPHPATVEQAMTSNADPGRVMEWPSGLYVGGYAPGDPRVVLMERAHHETAEGFVVVKASEIKAVFQMRVCRSTRVFDRDEDGPTKPMTAHCVEEAGHRTSHSNGYYTWRDPLPHIPSSGAGQDA